MSKDEHGLTPLQAVIKETIDKHPVLDDKEIARMVFDKRYPDEEYEGKEPSHTYVGKIRRRLAILGEPPEFVIEKAEEPEQPEEYEIDEPEKPEEPEIPFPDEFESPDLEPELEEPFPIDPVDGFTPDDTEFILTFTFDKFADWTGYEGWRFSTDSKGNLTDPNEKRFAGLTHRMMDKYMPDIFDLYFLEVMFCYTGIMILGSKTKAYLDWKKKKEPIIKDVESKVIEKPPKEELQEEDPEEVPEKANEDKELPPGALAHGEDDFQKRLWRRTA